MFSRNTSKLLTFHVTSDEPIDEGLELDEYDMSGWLLKKRRKRMQGKFPPSHNLGRASCLNMPGYRMGQAMV